MPDIQHPFPNIRLSVIIVNYNVRYFLDQCLNSVFRAKKEIPFEIFVVDNNSVDGSVEMVQEKYPSVILIANKENIGFSKANNLAIKRAGGEYVLLLNPDTVVEEDTFEKCLKFMDEHPEAGGLGVKMIDGRGNFLPESKRGLPTPAVAFYKIFGFSSLFPKSRRFGQYHLGFLDNEKIHPVEVLSGAFMMLRKTVLDKTGLLDEAFFMYGEDIDLSYRITAAGYKNYYFPETRIIHYKGESTKKSSVNYVFVFYRAMIIFARKHFSEKNARIFSLLIHIAIYFRAALALLNRFSRHAFLPLLDFSILLTGLFFIKHFYQQFTGIIYADELVKIAFPVYSFVWILTVYLTRGYSRPVKLSKISWGILAGTGVILIGYSLLPEIYRFSRALILLGSAWFFAFSFCLRYVLDITGVKDFKLGEKRKKRYAIVGDEEEIARVTGLLRRSLVHPDFIAPVNYELSRKPEKSSHIAYLGQLKEVIEIFGIDEVIFCAKNISSQNIISQMQDLDNTLVEFKIAPSESMFIIGSNSINVFEKLYPVERKKKAWIFERIRSIFSD